MTVQPLTDLERKHISDIFGVASRLRLTYGSFTFALRHSVSATYRQHVCKSMLLASCSSCKVTLDCLKFFCCLLI